MVPGPGEATEADSVIAGAEGVGRAATASFVYSFVIILILDLVLNLQLEALYRPLWPDQARLL